MARTKPATPAAELLLTEIEQLKAISDPVRLQMLEIMAEPPIQPWTAKELAARMGTKQTKLYHHLAVLEERGFIAVADTRVVSGILEKRYAATATSFRVDRALFGGGDSEAVSAVLDAIFEKARSEIVAGQRAGLLDLSAEEWEDRRMALWASHLRLSPASVRKVMRLVNRLGEIDGELDQPDGAHYGLVVAFYPRVGDESETDR
jgi:DNA-binding transcriptional ArsR family regulator